MNKLPPYLQWILETFFVAFIYVGTGKVGQAMALPETNVTILWPPSGIALAAVLLMGPRSWVGIGLGALVMNLWTLIDSAHPPVIMPILIVSSIIAFGSTLQPILGAWAVRRFSLASNPFSSIKSSISFLLISPLICGVSSTMGTYSLLQGEIISKELFQTVLSTWWAGDTIGVLIFTPFTLFLLRMNHLRKAILILIIALGLSTTYWISSSLRDQAEGVWYDNIEKTTGQLTSTFLLWLDLSYSAIHGTTALFNGSDTVSEDEFLNTVDNLEAAQTSNFPSSIAYAMKADETSPFTIEFSTNDLGLLATETSFDQKGPIGNLLERAWAEPQKIHIATNSGESQDTFLVAAIRADSTNQQGILVATIDLKATLHGLFARPEAKGLSLRLGEELTLENGKKGMRILYGEASPGADIVRSVEQRTISGTTVLDFRWDATSAFDDGADLELSKVILIGGTVSTLFSVLFIMFLFFQNERIQARVRERTEEVSNKTKLLQAIMASMGQGIVAFNNDLKVIAFNKQFLKIREYSDDIVFEGQDFKALIEHDVARNEFGKGDPEEILQEKVSSAVQFLDHHFERQRPNGRFVEVIGGPIPGGGFVSTYADVTDRVMANNKIAQQLKELDKARKATLNMMADAEAARKDLQIALNDMSASINYAARIQRSILPTEETFASVFADHFVIWEPRDKVGGDMYWCRHWGKGVLVILGDCTGHGVPGAFMTLISHGAIEEAALEVRPGNPAALLHRMHQLMQTSLGQIGSNDKDGSDDGIELAACYINENNSELIFAGARFDLYVQSETGLAIYKGDKVGLAYRSTPIDIQFNTHRISLSDDLTFYMASDGLTDQIGGEKKRGFGKRRFKELLEEHKGNSLFELGQKIKKTFVEFQGNEKRRDDLSVVGFKCNPKMLVAEEQTTSDMDDEWYVNFAPIDDDHKQLFGMINRLEKAIIEKDNVDGIATIYDELVDYTQWHFRHEERLMQENRYDGFDKHQKIHNSLSNQVKRTLQDIKDGNLDVSEDLYVFLWDWWYGHIQNVDKPLSKYLKKVGIVDSKNDQEVLFFVLDDTLKVGLSDIDDDHQVLVDLVNKLHSSVNNPLRQADVLKNLDELVDYTNWHFNHEERLMREYEYPDMISHLKMHEILMEKANVIRNKFKAKEEGAASELNNLIKTWLINHIHTVDNKLAAFLNKKMH
jgi:hemerythrin-like metal-binding protein